MILTHNIDCPANNCLDSFCGECCECGAAFTQEDYDEMYGGWDD